MFEGIHAAIGYFDYFVKDYEGGLHESILVRWKKERRCCYGGGGTWREASSTRVSTALV